MSFQHKVKKKGLKSHLNKTSKASHDNLCNIRSNMANEIKNLQARIQLECPEENIFDSHQATQENTTCTTKITRTMFSELSLSTKTQKALHENQFKFLTFIQKQCIPAGLLGYDILGEAETGSGKTLAFLIPVLENLYRQMWEKEDHVGALIISPTRELTLQIFDVLRLVGRYHTFSAMCLIGGKNVKQESDRLSHINIIIATPGRLLHHLEETPFFNVSHLPMLVIDEADLLLDMGFSETMTHIFEYLPSTETRQTFLFSATLSTNVHRLATVSLKDTVKKLSVRCNNFVPSKERLEQFYLILTLDNQINILFSILRSRSTKRMIVFVNSCKQVRYLCEIFWRLKPGCAVFEMHGRQNQQKRLDVLHSFSSKPSAACLICTDVAARGIDFPSVDIVIQLNCPPDISTYVHRIGRTARYEKSGTSILFLLESESLFLRRLEEHKITPQQLYMKPNKIIHLQKKLAGLLAANTNIKYLAQKAFISYLRSIKLFKDKGVFNYSQMVQKSDTLHQYAVALGLVGVPQNATQALAEQEKKKKLTKLERFKQKIQQKKQIAKQDDSIETSSIDSSKVISKKQKRLHRLRTLRETNKDSVSTNVSQTFKNDGQSDAFLHPTVPSLPFSTTTNVTQENRLATLMNRKDVQKKLKKQQIKIRLDGTAKIKGLAMLSNELMDKSHHFFFEENPESDLQVKTPFQAIVHELNSCPNEKDSVDNTTYIETLKEKLNATQHLDKERERQRIRQRHSKKRDRPFNNVQDDVHLTKLSQTESKKSKNQSFLEPQIQNIQTWESEALKILEKENFEN